MPLRVRPRLAQADTWLLEVFLSVYTLLWGVGLANPLTNVFASNPTAYALLALFPGGEPALGAFTVALALAKIAAAAAGTRRRRALVHLLLAVFWAAITVAIGVPTHGGAGGLPHFALVALANWYIWARLSVRVAP